MKGARSTARLAAHPCTKCMSFVQRQHHGEAHQQSCAAAHWKGAVTSEAFCEASVEYTGLPSTVPLLGGLRGSRGRVAAGRHRLPWAATQPNVPTSLH